MLARTEFDREFASDGPRGRLEEPPTAVAAESVFKACIENVQQFEMYARQIQERAVNDALGRVEVIQKKRHGLARCHALRPLKASFKLRREMRGGIGDHAEKCPQFRKKRMRHNLPSPFVGGL